jgi:hypothetical protein
MARTAKAAVAQKQMNVINIEPINNVCFMDAAEMRSNENKLSDRHRDRVRLRLKLILSSEM